MQPPIPRNYGLTAADPSIKEIHKPLNGRSVGNICLCSLSMKASQGIRNYAKDTERPEILKFNHVKMLPILEEMPDERRYFPQPKLQTIDQLKSLIESIYE